MYIEFQFVFWDYFISVKLIMLEPCDFQFMKVCPLDLFRFLSGDNMLANVNQSGIYRYGGYVHNMYLYSFNLFQKYSNKES